MIKKYAAIFFFFFLLFLLDVHSYGDETNNSIPDYSGMVKQLKNGDRSVDFSALRYSYAKTQNYNPYGGDDADKDAMHEALNNSKFEKAITHAQAVLENNYVDMDAHFVCSIAYRETKNAEKQNYHSFILKGLLGSIYDSGKGQTPETAFVVINTGEEYFFLNVYGFDVTETSLLNINGHSYDKMVTEDRKTGEEMIFYFNVDMPFNWLSSQMGGQKE